MRRYDVLGDRFDFVETNNGDVIFYDDFVEFISARIEKLEKEVEGMENQAIYDRQRPYLYGAINELKCLLYNEKKS